jgi:hypothetical protein
MKEIIKKILHGFLIGFGFSVALGATYYFVTQELTESAMSAYSFEEGTIEITKHKKIERDGKLLILGEVTNTGSDQAKGVNVVVDLYLGDEFVKQCDESITGGVAAGETRNFEMSCGGGCKKNPIVEHDSYEMYVSGY